MAPIDTVLAMARFVEAVYPLCDRMKSEAMLRKSLGYSPDRNASLKALAKEWTQAFEQEFGRPFESPDYLRHKALVDVAVGIIRQLRSQCPNDQLATLCDAFIDTATNRNSGAAHGMTSGETAPQ